MAQVTRPDLEARLAEAAARLAVVGAVVSVSFDGVQTEAATGSLDSRTDEPVTVESPFRLGSITKVMTAIGLTQLLEGDGRSLDEPVEQLLPGTTPQGVDAPITWRHLLTHRSGIDGTYWAGFGDGRDAVARYAEASASLATAFAPGDSWGYSNSGYVVAGAAIERLAGSAYDQVMLEHVVFPLGLATTRLWSEEPPQGAATGHHATGDGARPAESPVGLRSLSPAGATAFTTAADAIRLMDAALADTGSALAAQALPLPPGGGPTATHQAPGWKVHRWDDVVVFGHDGGASGQGSFVRWIPATRSGIALLANTAPTAMLLWDELSRWFFEQAGVTVPGWLRQDEHATVEPELCGTYRCRDATFTVTPADDALRLQVEGLGGALVRDTALKPLRSRIYRSEEVVTDVTRIVSFEETARSGRLIHSGPFTAPVV